MTTEKEQWSPGHKFRDPGTPIAEPDFVARPAKNWWGRAVDPEQYLAEAFSKLGKDYGGKLPADFVLHAVMQSGSVLGNELGKAHLSNVTP
jgi:hypothetical protein